MDLQILNDRMKELENELKDIRAKLEEAEKEQKSGRWKPKLNETYWFVNGLIRVVADICDDCEIDMNRYAIGNCFATQEEAEFMVERLKVIEEMKEFAEPEDRLWDCNNTHYCIYYDYFDNRLDISWVKHMKYNNIYFESEEKAQQCIAAVGGKRIRKYFLEVKE